MEIKIELHTIEGFTSDELIGLRSRLQVELEGLHNQQPLIAISKQEKEAPPGSQGGPELVQWLIHFSEQHPDIVAAAFKFTLNAMSTLINQIKSPKVKFNVTINGKEIEISKKYNSLEEFQQDVTSKANGSN